MSETTNYNTGSTGMSNASHIFFQFHFNSVVMFVAISACVPCWANYYPVLQILTLRRQGRTLFPTVPENAEREAQSLFVQEVSWFKGPENTCS